MIELPEWRCGSTICPQSMTVRLEPGERLTGNLVRQIEAQRGWSINVTEDGTFISAWCPEHTLRLKAAEVFPANPPA
jgi:hypothetical protein